jgi:Delta3-Delta2-enoyl-CoA isomerase
MTSDMRLEQVRWEHLRWEHLRSEQQGGVVTLHLQRGKANALNAEMLEELERAVERAATEQGVRALVLASALPRVFCAGFDVAEVFAYDRPTMLTFFRRFVRLFERLRSLPKPVVCSLSGHAFAGGAILALGADFRVMAEGANWSVNEVDLGVVLPGSVIRALASVACPPIVRGWMLNAEVLGASAALHAGLVRQVLAADAVLPAASTLAASLAAKPQAAWAAHKLALLAPVEVATEAEIVATIDSWFSPEAMACRAALVARLAAKS